LSPSSGTSRSPLRRHDSGLAAAVIRRCIEDEEFRTIFAEDETIMERWP
jgi:hypothetical protein